MAIVFAVRADNDNYTARYSLNSTEAKVAMGTISRDVDVTAINGYSFNLTSGGTTAKCIQWPFRDCLVTAEMSVLMRLKITNTNQMGFWQIGQACGHSINNTMLYQSSNLWQMVCFGSTWNAGAKSGSWSSAGAPPTGAWCDVVFTWTGGTGSNAFKLWVNGTNVDSNTVVNSRTAPCAQDTITVGGVTSSVFGANFSFEELVVWNEVIDPTSVALVSGTGSLNGSSRTSLVSVSAFSGEQYTDPGVANVRLATSYIFEGSTLTGALVVDYPTTTSVRFGDVYDDGGKTGSLVVPSAANVRSGVTFDNGTVGTLDDDAERVVVEVASYDTVTVTVTEI